MSEILHLDPELISAYIDDEVSAAERQHVEAHLATCAVCRAEVAEMRWAVNLVASVPSVAVPRTFYLTEEMIAPTTRQSAEPVWLRWLRPLMTMATAATALLFVVLFTTSLLGGGGSTAMAPMPAMQRQAEKEVAPMAAEAPASAPADVAPLPTATLSIIVEKETENGAVDGSAGGSAPAAPPAEPTAESTVRIAEPTMGAEEGAGSGLPPTSTVAADVAIGAAPAPTSDPYSSATQADGDEPAPLATGVASYSLETLPTTESQAGDTMTTSEGDELPTAQSPADQQWWRVGVVGLLTLLLGAITLWLRRMNSPTNS